MQHDRYNSPFSARYASKEMQYIFSEENKFKTWRKLWISLARAEKAQGVPISDEQIKELETYAEDINFEVAQAREREVRHDVMSHVYAYGQQCPKAKGIIHLGATSCYVGDNTDIIVMRQGLKLIDRKLLSVIALLANFADKYKDMPALAYTHLQPAQLTTVGKRASLWLWDLYMDRCDLAAKADSLLLLGSKGTTGTQASFMELFEGDENKIKAVEEQIAHEMGFSGSVPVSGQTYSRKIDFAVLSVLSGIAQSAAKFSGDMRLLQGFKEIEEPFEKSQIGSSAMPYKRNPMRCERIGALSRYLICDLQNPAFTAASQWLERSLDDSANRRVAVAEAFLAADGILNIMLDVCDGIVVYPKMIRSRVMSELPFMATENIMMTAVKKGGDRQQLHEKLRQHSMAAAKQVKEEGLANDLLERIAGDEIFGLSKSELEKLMKPENFIGRAPAQVTQFLKEYIRPMLDENGDSLGVKASLTV